MSSFGVSFRFSPIAIPNIPHNVVLAQSVFCYFVALFLVRGVNVFPVCNKPGVNLL
jgi:hypothetical protein